MCASTILVGYFLRIGDIFLKVPVYKYKRGSHLTPFSFTLLPPVISAHSFVVAAGQVKCMDFNSSGVKCTL